MKLMTGAAVAVWLVAASMAMAQTTTTTTTTTATTATTTAPAGPPAVSRCGAPPPQPTIPARSTTTAAPFQVATATFNTWVTATNANLQCRAQEVREHDATTQSLLSQYRAEAEAGQAATQAMQAQQTANNTAHPTRGHSRGGSQQQ